MIYLVLHGETEWNRERRFQGRLDSPLTPEGVLQARLAGIKLAGLIGDTATCRVVSSPLHRARKTADIICAALGIASEHLALDPRLMEIDLGSWAGLTREEVEEAWPRPLDGANRYDWYFRSPDGEPLEAVTVRLREWLANTQNRGITTVAVSHGVASRILRGLYTNLPIEEALSLEVSRDAIFQLDNGHIQRISCKLEDR